MHDFTSSPNLILLYDNENSNKFNTSSIYECDDHNQTIVTVNIRHNSGKKGEGANAPCAPPDYALAIQV
jgi:hypothetical protein